MESSSSLDDEMGSLFEGMVLFAPSQIPEPSQQHQHDPSPPPSSSSPLPEPSLQEPSPTPSPSSSAPLDENLFSDLTLFSPIDTLQSQPDLSTTTETVEPPSSITRQISRRKKKAGIKIGYGRDTFSISEEQHQQYQSSPSSSLSNSRSSSANEINSFPLPSDSPTIELQKTTQSDSPTIELQKTTQSDSSFELPEKTTSDDGLIHEATAVTQSDSPFELPEKTTSDDGLIHEATAAVEPISIEEEHVVSAVSTARETVEDKLEKIRVQIEETLKGIRETAGLVSAMRKESAKKRRKTAENVNLSSLKHTELEKELGEACEAEDFEKAEGLSEKIAAVEKEKEDFMNELRDAEADCDSVDSKMQEVLELLITTEEGGVALLEQYAKDAADNANLVLKNAEEFSSREMDEWLSSVEALEVKKLELEIQSHLINGARLGLNDFIEHTVEDDTREKIFLCKKREVLTEELENLLAVVRQKEAEIAENDSYIQEVEKRISGALSGFQEVQSSIDTRYNNMQSVLLSLDAESEALSVKGKEIEELLSNEEKRAAKLKEFISDAMDEARKRQELAELRKSLALPILKYMEVKGRLAKAEEKILEEVQSFKQEVSGARGSLQELSAARSSIQQEVASAKQRIFFIDKRIPELEAEKKVAAAARNFKEAGRIAAEAKTLGVEKENIQTKLEADILQLQKMEEQINDTVQKLNEAEELILSKEKEAAMTGYERQRLIAAAAMAERSAALELGDLDEANTLGAEAEAADSEATKFQQAYDLNDKEFETIAKNLISIDLIANMGGEQLAKMAASVSLSTE